SYNTGVGILVFYNGSGAATANNQILSNTITFNGSDGVVLQSGARPPANLATTIAANTIASNTGNGVSLILTSGATITSNTITKNTADGVKIDTGTGNSVLSNSIFADGNLEIELVNSGNKN